MDKFTQAYIECALWASRDDEGGIGDFDSINDLAPEALQSMIDDCEAFQRDNADFLRDIDSEQAGHDFWLTRNRHGAGFWDRGLGEVGRKLTNAAHAYGSCDLYLGDDGKIHHS